MITRREFTALAGVVLGAPSVLLGGCGGTSPTAATPAPKSSAPANMRMVGTHEDVVRLYIKEVERVPRLSEAEEVEQRERAACGDQVATQRLLEAHLQHVVLVAKDYADRGLDLLDLIQEGNMGLIRAATKLNEIPPGMTFRDFATASIRQSIEERLSRDDGAFVLPPSNLTPTTRKRPICVQSQL